MQKKLDFEGYTNIDLKRAETHIGSGPDLKIPNPVRAAQRRLSSLSVFHKKSVLYGAFVWACRALNIPKRRFPARADQAVPERPEGHLRAAAPRDEAHDAEGLQGELDTVRAV